MVLNCCVTSDKIILTLQTYLNKLPSLLILPVTGVLPHQGQNLEKQLPFLNKPVPEETLILPFESMFEMNLTLLLNYSSKSSKINVFFLTRYLLLQFLPRLYPPHAFPSTLLSKPKETYLNIFRTACNTPANLMSQVFRSLKLKLPNPNTKIILHANFHN